MGEISSVSSSLVWRGSFGAAGVATWSRTESFMLCLVHQMAEKSSEVSTLTIMLASLCVHLLWGCILFVLNVVELLCVCVVLCVDWVVADLLNGRNKWFCFQMSASG